MRRPSHPGGALHWVSGAPRSPPRRRSDDFVQVAQLRGAFTHALSKHPEGLVHRDIARKRPDALALSPADYAQAPGARSSQRRAAERALRDVIDYRLYIDLKAAGG